MYRDGYGNALLHGPPQALQHDIADGPGSILVPQRSLRHTNFAINN